MMDLKKKDIHKNMQKMSLILKCLFKKWKYFFMQNDIFHIWTD